MKKRIISIVVTILTISQIGFAQLYVGPRVGGSLSNVSTPSFIDLIAPDFQHLPAFEFGVAGEYAISDQMAITGDIIYREKGFRVTEDMDINVFDLDVPLGVRVDTRLRYLDVPVMFKYKFGQGQVGAYLAAGPQFGYALNGKIKTRADFLVDWNLTNTSINLDGLGHRRFDVGGVVGAGVEYATSQGKLFADVRYQQGFMDSFNVPLIELDVRNHGFGFGIGYKFQL